MAAPGPAKKPMLDYALEYLSMGYPVFPVCSPLMGVHQHRINGKLHDCPPEKRGKNPMTRWKQCQDELPSKADVAGWWSRWPAANIGMATGKLSGVIVLDCDSGEARQDALERGGLEKTPAVWTGTPGGIHFWIEHPGYDVRNFVREIEGTDFRGDGGYVLLPPSVHRNHGAVYRWNEHTVGRKLARVPDWLAACFKAKTSPTASGGGFMGDVLDVEASLQGFDRGERDNGLFKLACRFRHDDQPIGYAEMMIAVAAQNCRPPFDADEAIEKVRYVYQKYEVGDVGPTVVEDEYFSPPGGTLPGPAPDPPAAIFSRPISELLSQPDVDPDWMVDQLFTVGSNGWVAAEPKVGKSWVVLELTYALSTGSPFLGRFAVKQPRRVLYIQEEDTETRVKRRLKRLIQGDATRRPPSDEYFRYVIRLGFKLDSLPWMEALRQDIEIHKPEIVVMDVFNRLHGADENNQKEMTALLNQLIRLNNQYGCSFLLVHHNKKAQAGLDVRANQMIRGSGVLAGWAECSLYLRRSKDKDTIIVTPESKDAPEMDDFTVVLQDQDNGGIFLQVGDAEPVSRMSKADIEAIDAVRSISARGIGATVQAVAAALDKDRTTVQRRLTRLVEAGYLTSYAISDAPKATHIYEVAEQ